MHKIMICSSDPRQAEVLLNLVIRALMIQPDELRAKLLFGALCYSASELLERLKAERLTAGIYLLDKVGAQELELAETLKKLDQKAQLIFITENKELAFELFERRLPVFDCILQTSDQVALQRRLTETLTLVVAEFNKYHLVEKNTFCYRNGRQIYNIDINEVVWVGTTERPHHLRLHLLDKTVEFTGTLHEVKERASFLAPLSRSCLVNVKNISQIDLKKRKVIFVTGQSEYFPRRASKNIQTLVDLLTTTTTDRAGK